MATEKKSSPFSRPQPQGSPVLGPEADKWISEGNTPGVGVNIQTATPEVKPQVKEGNEKAVPTSTKPEAMKRLTIDIPLKLHIRVKNGCTDRGMKMADVIRDLLDREFPDQKRRK